MIVAGITAIIFSSCDKDDNNYGAPEHETAFAVTLAAGDSSAIIGKVNSFRERAGKVINTVPSVTGGRREINWDGVPADFLSPLAFPFDFFNPTLQSAPDARKRGLVYFPENASLLVSDKNFAEIDPAFANEFKAFSKNKLFIPKGTNVSEVHFQVPGTTTSAYVTAFGLILSDVDQDESTIIEAYEGDKLIGRVKAQKADKKYSFVGFQTTTRKITRVKITAGNTAIAAGITDGVEKDIVALDDFIYSEPRAN